MQNFAQTPLVAAANYRWAGGLIVDNFAGGGGASTGIAEGTGRSPDIAVNHNAEALMMHKQNHPETRHYNESVWDIDIKAVTGGKPVLLGWFSPDCTHFSVAKGGKPVKKVIRGLAWIVKKWYGQSDMAVIKMENVTEFMTWGPLIAKRCPTTKRVIKLVADGLDKKKQPKFKEVVSEPGEQVPYREQALIPDKKRAGKTFKQFIRQMREAGYEVEWKEKGLVASDFGDPTTRKRFFLIARKDGLPIVWPTPTHGDPKKHADRLPWKTAGENLDWSIPAPSIFAEGRKKLAPNTLKRIAKGIQKFVIGAGDDAFLVKTNHAYDQFRGQSLHDPLQTITGKLGTGVVAASLVPTGYGERQGQETRTVDINAPLPTIVSTGKHGIVAASLMKFRGDSAGSSAHEPCPTITAGGGAARPAGAAHALGALECTLAEAGFIATIDHTSSQDTATSMAQPIGTVTSKARHVKVAALLKHYSGVVGQDLTLPLPTITAKDHNAMMSADLLEVAHIQRDFGNSVGHGADEPLGAITAGGGGHSAVVATSLIKLKGTSNHGQSVDRPLDAIAAQGNHFGAVTAHLTPCHSSSLEWGDEHDRDGGVQGAGSRGDIRGQVRRDDLEAGRPDELREGEAKGTQAAGHSSEQRVSGGEFLLPGQAVHGERPSGSIRGASGSDTSGTGHKPRKGEQARQQPRVPGADDAQQEPFARVQNETQGSGDSPDRSKPVGASERAEGQGSDVSGDSGDFEHLTNHSLQGRVSQVQSFLMTYYGTGQPISLDEPLDTITSKGRFGLVTIHGVDYQIVDIGMRMLEPHELYRCQGFPADYQHAVVMGKPLPKHAQVRMVGNSVPPGLARALVAANIPSWALNRQEVA